MHEQKLSTRSDVECLTRHMAVIAQIMNHADLHLNAYHSCTMRRLFNDISLDLYAAMKQYAADVAQELGPPPPYECDCGFHDGGPELTV